MLFSLIQLLLSIFKALLNKILVLTLATSIYPSCLMSLQTTGTVRLVIGIKW